ncbi:hypothetical protein SAMN05192558_114117 [Actinokineospora alba]|uniref:LPXTG-motif cell wall anchor domain-containing protein n=1 Tax=Actinokineospora alba TaxID=504798 RepID=A0A1H0VKP6_9PSEU|nr:choice-of-anchor P family protein [Actinokineospora alba]TDP67646.1 hypothetical protein C8E96_3192 [Actinokineospora alba]SDJ29316.1 hypothetical protein SAMN05421871_112117 [Actinokineospora alba]SDP79097.1 hypothetical protein SAMN05192558_114117 [Actinokineospora alba]
MHKHMVRRGGVVGLLAAAALVAGALPASAAPGDGSAFVVSADLTLVGGPAINVGPLAPSHTDGPTTAEVASVSIPNVLTTGLATSEATRDDATGVVHSEASVANVALTLGGFSGSIGLVEAFCDATQSGNSGSSSIINGTFGGQSLPASPPPNTVIAIPPGPTPVVSLTLNEQITNPDGSLTVNAIHIRVNSLLASGDVIISSATCGPAAPPIPMASGLGLWIGLGLLGAVAIPVGFTVIRKRRTLVTG